MKNVAFYRNLDFVVEHCTIDWESYYPCHFMHLWWVLNDQVLIPNYKKIICAKHNTVKEIAFFLIFRKDGGGAAVAQQQSDGIRK
jgi:hypothetical protein